MRGLSTSLSCVAPSTKRQSASVVRDAPSMRIAEAKERRNLTPLTVNEPLICWRSEEHTSELQSLMRISYAVFCLKKKKIYELLKHTPFTNHDNERVCYTVRRYSTIHTLYRVLSNWSHM